MRRIALVSLAMASVLAVAGCSSMPNDMTRYKWAGRPAVHTDGVTWPDYDQLRHATEELPGAGKARLMWSDDGVFAKLTLPPDSPEQFSVNLVYTQQDGTVRKGRVTIRRQGRDISTDAQRTDPGTDTWIAADNAAYSRVAARPNLKPPQVQLFLAWNTVGLDEAPKDRAWVVIDPAGSQPAGEKPPVPIRLYVDTRPDFRGARARCPYCSQ